MPTVTTSPINWTHALAIGAGAVVGAALLPVVGPVILPVVGLGAVAAAVGIPMTAGVGAALGAVVGHFASGQSTQSVTTTP